MGDPALITAAVAAAELSARQFAERIMGRDERTIRRWTAGEVAIPPHARAFLARWLALSDLTRKRIVGALTHQDASM